MMVGKIKIEWAGSYHPDMGRNARDPALDKREAKEKASALKKEAVAAREAGPR